jgi:aldose 1-epimerase
MTAGCTPFGTLADGRAVQAVRLAWPGGVEAEILDYGAVVRSLRFGEIETVLGFDTLEAYVADRAYQGCVVGRCANRIDHARFEIDGRAFQVEANEGPNVLHGGPVGFGRRLWILERSDDLSATLSYRSPEGEEGFPGTLDARIKFRLAGASALEITWLAQASAATPVNLTHHLYFNLSGDPSTSVLDHVFGIEADAITPVRPDLIPTGELMPVDATPFDLRQARTLGEILAERHPQLTIGGGFDHNWMLKGPARLACPRTGLSMTLTTDQPGLQVYSGQGLTAPFAAHGGIALEPQGFPDAVNHANFPNVVLRPGQTYRRRAVYRFAGPAL